MSLKGIKKSDGTVEYIYADDTLSEENAPGEAKAAGDRIAGVEGRITTLETAAPEIISNATKDWLDDNVTPTGSAVAIDSSLTQSGLAADAKATGDELGNLKSDFNEQQIKDFYNFARESNYYNLIWTENKYIKQNGDVGNLSGVYATLDYYPVHQGDILHIRVAAPGQSDVCVFYNAQKQFVSYFTISASNKNYLFTAPSDGFIRLSNEPSYVPNENAFMLLTNPTYKSMEEVEGLFDTIETLETKEFDLVWADNKWVKSVDGGIGNDNNFACTVNYYPVYKGQILKVNLFAAGTNECSVAFYDESKTYLHLYETSTGVKFVTVPQTGFARFTTKKSNVPTTSAYVIIADIEKDEMAQKYVSANVNANIGNETSVDYTAKYAKNELLYSGEVSPQKRYLAIGFDDFRESDFSSIIPIFNKHRANATFNKVATGNAGTVNEQRDIGTVINNCHEIGDHTFLHYAFPYTNANFNGQNPTSADGNQTPYPTNAMMREDAGSGNNAFGLALTSAVNISGCSVTANWGDLTDAQCQTIRESFSVLKNATFAPLIDSLSNKYLGTTGASAGSYDSETGKYTGGIFTGCETSENHEVWERILTIVQMYYKDQFGLAFNFKCWSLPGTNGFNYGLLYDSKKYYDTDHEKLFNMNARFTSSLTGETRSFAEVLEQFGYLYTHDFNYPGRLDGGSEHMINKQFIINANLSRKNGIVYPTNRTINYADISAQYPSTFFTDGIPKGQQMYEATGTFRTFIEALRNDTARGIIRGEVIDSDNSYSMRTFFDELLKFCKVNGIEVITKSQANDICFNHPIRTGNLLYNPLFENSIKKAYPNASDIPSAPDGVSGNCEVYKDPDGIPILKTLAGTDIYISQYGIPFGKIKLKVDLKNNAASQYMIVYAIKNSDPYYFLNANDHILATAYPSSNDWATYEKTFVIPDVDETAFDQNYSGMGDKICGIYIRLSGALEVKNMSLVLT